MIGRIRFALAHRFFLRCVSTFLLCSSIVWVAGYWAFIVAAVPGPAGDVSVRIDQYGWIFQLSAANGETPFARIIPRGNSLAVDWSISTQDASSRVEFPGLIAAEWKTGRTVMTRLFGVRHWLFVLMLFGLVAVSLRCQRGIYVEVS